MDFLKTRQKRVRNSSSLKKKGEEEFLHQIIRSKAGSYPRCCPLGIVCNTILLDIYFREEARNQGGWA